MKIRHHLAAFLLFLCSLIANAADQRSTKTTLVDGAPAGFVHIRMVYNGSDDEEVTDFYIKASSITSVAVTNLHSKETKTREIYLTLATTELHRTNVSEPHSPKKYNLNFENVGDAEKAALRIMAIAGQAEQGGAAQPATAPESKSEGEDKPQPESKPAPR
jgi:hypothetical protein